MDFFARPLPQGLHPLSLFRKALSDGHFPSAYSAGPTPLGLYRITYTPWPVPLEPIPQSLHCWTIPFDLYRLALSDVPYPQGLYYRAIPLGLLSSAYTAGLFSQGHHRSALSDELYPQGLRRLNSHPSAHTVKLAPHNLFRWAYLLDLFRRALSD